MNEYLLDQLRNAREAQEKASSEMKAMIEKVKQDDTYTSLQAAAMLAEGEIERLTEAIHDEAMHQYSVDGNKHPHPKVEIKAFKIFSITDLEVLTNWCKENMRVAFKLDTKQIEKYALKETKVSVPGTSVAEELRVQIAREL